MADLETSYLAVRGALVDALVAAWSPAEVYFDPFQVEESYTNFPVLWIDAEISSWENETPATDELVVRFTITGIFAGDAVNGNDAAFVARVSAAQAELYGVLNLGGYGYLGQMSDATRIDLDGTARFGVQIVYSCAISIERA